MLTDTHTHLYLEAFDEDRDAMMNRAREAGVGRFFLPAIDSSYVPAMELCKERYPQEVYLMAGLHPTHVKEDFLKELDLVEKQLEQGGYVAVGEIRMSWYWDKTLRDLHISAFRLQIHLAKTFNLPIVIHCREAFDEIFQVLEEEKHGQLRGIFHCFTGTHQQAKRAIALNMKLGIGGVVTFKNGKIDRFIHQIPLEQIVLETDSPYLAPVPYRGKRNENAYLSLVAQRLADLYGQSREEIARITTENSKAVFGC